MLESRGSFELAKSAAKGKALAAMVIPPTQLPLHPAMVKRKHESGKVDNPLVARELRYSERPAGKCSTQIPNGQPNDCSDYSNADDNFQEEVIALQRQQTTLQIQPNRIVELLAVSQNINKFPQER